jgi:hypothetical protein
VAPQVPFTFEPDASEYEVSHLQYKDASNGQTVTWGMMDISILIPKHDYYPDHDAIEKANGKLVKFHGSIGFSVGTYHEFFVSELPGFLGFRMGRMEVTFGQATPLMAYLFEGHRSKYFGSWDQIATARITGAANFEEAEASFVSAAVRYKERMGPLPQVWAMEEWWDEEEEEAPHQPALVEVSPPILELEPIRFFYHGLTQSDASAACLYFYRVLEFYSFLSNKQQIQKMRGDASLSEEEFAKRMLQLVAKDEKGPLLQLINSIADDDTLKLATSTKMIQSENSSLLGEAIYAFRNSIVHGKLSYGYDLQSTPILTTDDKPLVWRNILRGLAQRSMNAYGRRAF